MTIKQLSVFIENRDGSLGEVTAKLAENDINIISLSLADTTDYGMLRMIVSDPKKGKEVLKEAGFSAMITEVIAVKLPNEKGRLGKLLDCFVDKNISIEYMYALSTGENPALVLKITNVEMGIRTLMDAGYELMCTSEAASITDCINK